MFQTGAPMQQPMMGSFGTVPSSVYAGGMPQQEKVPSFIQQKQQQEKQSNAVSVSELRSMQPNQFTLGDVGNKASNATPSDPFGAFGSVSQQTTKLKSGDDFGDLFNMAKNMKPTASA